MMKKDELQRKITQHWGANSDEAKLFKDIYRKSLKWEKYEYEKYGLGAHNEVPNRPQHRQEQNSVPPSRPLKLPKDRDIFRATWSYFLARAAFIFMMWIIFIIVMVLLFWGMYAAIDPPSWKDVRSNSNIEQHRIIR